MDIKVIRRKRLRKLIDERYGKVAAQLAAKIERQPDYVSRLLSDNEKHRRDLGEKLAREIERKVGLATGWLDIEEDTTERVAQQPLALYSIEQELQHRIIGLFDKLTPPQQQQFLSELETAVQANIETVRYLGGRLKGVPAEKAAKHLPRAPKEPAQN